MKHKISLLVVLIGLLFIFSYSTPEPKPEPTVVAKKEISLANRQHDPYVNSVFKDNILLNLAYMRGIVKNPAEIDWNSVRKPFEYRIVLKPSETFAFHDDAPPEVKKTIVATTHAQFNASQGFKFSGYLVGDGVCHLASLINWAAQEAHLDVKSPTNHNFAKINEVPKEYGTAIYFMPGSTSANAQQNLYVTNNKEKHIALKFVYKADNLQVVVEELN